MKVDNLLEMVIINEVSLCLTNQKSVDIKMTLFKDQTIQTRSQRETENVL